MGFLSGPKDLFIFTWKKDIQRNTQEKEKIKRKAKSPYPIREGKPVVRKSCIGKRND